MKMINRHAAFLSVAIVLLGQGQSLSLAQTTSDPTVPFSAAQAAQGKSDYGKHCASCHGDDLAGIHLAPSLVRGRFDRNWRGKSVDILAFHLRRMPMKPVGTPGSLSDESYVNILAYILASNGFAPGDDRMPSDSTKLAKLTIPRTEGAEYDPDAPVALSAAQKRLLENLPAVTDQMLRNPAADDWLQWGRTQDGHGFSPLKQVDKQTVGDLQLAWRAPLGSGASMPTPLVHHGIMYLHNFPDTVLAMDASNGDVLWRHQHNPTSGISTKKMGLGLHGEKVFAPTSDLHVLALHAKTGKLIWDHTITPDTDPRLRSRYQLRSAPLVVGDKVIQGVTASGAPKGGFIIAINIDSGEEVWRFNTIARPGEPGGNSWNGLELEERSGGSVWHQGTYDAELNLIYFGVAPTYDTGPLLHSVNRTGITNDALYTNCTLALSADTGELVWHYQHMPNDQWDLDWVFERQIMKLPINGEIRKVVINVGKMAILEALDAATGEYLFSIDSGLQNVITSIDEKTGKKTFSLDVEPNPEKPCLICPSAFGARSWPPTSYSPQTKLVYVPLTKWCMKMSQEGLRILTSGVGLSSAPHPASDDGNVGRLQAINIETQELAWAFDQVAPPTTSLLATGGGLVFSGDLEPSIKAFDDTSGKLLWQATLDDLPSSSLVTYSVNEKQYVSVVVGQTNNHVRDLKRTYDEVRARSGQEINDAPVGGAAIWTFALNNFVREWTVQDLAAELVDLGQGRSFSNGERIFASASCKACHSSEGAGVQRREAKLGLSLSEMSQKISDGKIDRIGLLTEILQPSKRIDEKFRTQVITTNDGVLVSGVVVHEDDTIIRLLSNPLNEGEKPKEVAKSEIDQRAESETSLMPLGLLNVLSKQDILDLLSYIESGGDPAAGVFRRD
jgi:alcohol dehydrogenase (cytochrome c)